MEYKNFLAQITYNKGAHRFDGTVIGANQEIVFTGKSIDDLEANFKEVVDRYLARCATKKIDPYKTYSGKIPLRFSDKATHRECALAAQKAGMSLNKWIEVACLEKL